MYLSDANQERLATLGGYLLNGCNKCDRLVMLTEAIHFGGGLLTAVPAAECTPAA